MIACEAMTLDLIQYMSTLKVQDIGESYRYKLLISLEVSKEVPHIKLKDCLCTICFRSLTLKGSGTKKCHKSKSIWHTT